MNTFIIHSAGSKLIKKYCELRKNDNIYIYTQHKDQGLFL